MVRLPPIHSVPSVVRGCEPPRAVRTGRKIGDLAQVAQALIDPVGPRPGALGRSKTRGKRKGEAVSFGAMVQGPEKCCLPTT